MKTFKLLITIIILVVGFSASASPNLKKDKVKEKKEVTIHTKIVKLLSNSTIVVDEETVAQVSFIINCKGEIVVLSVDSDIFLIESFIKNRLNYSKIAENGENRNQIFNLPVKFLASR